MSPTMVPRNRKTLKDPLPYARIPARETETKVIERLQGLVARIQVLKDNFSHI